jgi:hypothetical protein
MLCVKLARKPISPNRFELHLLKIQRHHLNMHRDTLQKIAYYSMVWLMYAHASLAQDILSSEQMRQDFIIFEKALIEAHPGLYRYNTPAHADSIFVQTALKLDHPMTRQEFYRTLLPVAVLVKCGHTKFHPDENWSDNFYFGTEKVFPLKLYIHEDKAWIVDSYDPEFKVIKGAEVLSINNLSMPEIICKLLPGFFSDGSNTTFKFIEMSHYFSAYYANMVEAPDSFIINCRSGNDYSTMKVPSVSHLVIDQYEKEQSSNTSPEEPYSLKILPGNTALLTITSFWMGGDGAFKRFLKNSFSTIRQNEIDNLIIDVRNNEGGNDKRGALLLSWFMNEKFRYYDRLQATTKSKYTFKQYAHLPKFYGIMRHLIHKTDSGTYVWNHSRNLKIQKPQKNSYSGKVYMLINGGSFSVTSEFASVAHYLKRAVFIGEETGGGYYGNNSGTFVIVTLPNSRLNIGIPMLAYYTAVKNYPFTDRGVIPDYKVSPTIEDLLNKKDTVLSFALELIAKQK